MAEGQPPVAESPTTPRRYRWRWLIALAVLIAILLAVLWMSQEVARIKRLRDHGQAGPAICDRLTHLKQDRGQVPSRVPLGGPGRVVSARLDSGNWKR